ncbi:1-acyl-sn-glycerol-3-phosphate acyltransferase, partial [bacterium]|nr:1-acyl-sn-glycerol-3-phosphate acyltransferase [bacterium]
NKFYLFAHHLLRLLFRVFYGMNTVGLENIPAEGRVIFAPNHIAAFDPMVVGVACNREITFLGKKELFDILVLGFLIRNLNVVPVDRGAGDVSALKTMIRALKKERAILLFPEGTRSRTEEINPGKGGIGFIAASARADILPVYVTGTKRTWWRFFQGPKMKTVFGKPISIAELLEIDLKGKALYQYISNSVIDEIKKLRDENTA